MANESDKERCQQCGNSYSKIGSHWSRGSCDHPQLTEEQKRMCDGIVMGDGSINKYRTNAYVRIGNTNKKFLEEIDEKMGIMATGVRVEKTAEQVKEVVTNRKHRYINENPENCKPIYFLRMRSHPYFNKYREWYSPDGKRYTDGMSLTPTSLKYWYAGDGSVNWMRGSPRIQISSRNEEGQPEVCERMFRDIGFEAKWNRHMMYFNKRDSQDLIEWMGDAPRGFEYKWEVRDEGRYHELKP